MTRNKNWRIILQGERILSLDFLKAVAIIAVVLGHIASPP